MIKIRKESRLTNKLLCEVLKKLPSIKEQARALVSHTRFELVCAYLERDRLDAIDYKKIFTATKDEILSCIREEYLLDELVHLTESFVDGFYAIKNNNSWLTYRQERNVKFDKKIVYIIDDVWKQYLLIELGYDNT